SILSRNWRYNVQLIACDRPTHRYSHSGQCWGRTRILGKEKRLMGFKQTSEHRFGKHSYHQIGLVRGQFGNVPTDKWLSFVAATGFDGWEEASWELDLNHCATDVGAEACAKERVELDRQLKIELFMVDVPLLD